LIVRQSELDFPVTTDSATVKRFLLEGAAPAKPHVKIVFSTYQSAKVVARAFPPTFQFDLAIFDEAHKTAGREGRDFSFALKDKNLPITNRLFLTATPRHYDVRKRDKEGDAKLVYSMDAPEAYGPVAHTLSFAEAARRGIICNYKVIISVVTSDLINDHLLKHGKVLVKGDEIHARQVANQLALKAAVEKHGVRKIFTFHRSVASAKSFVTPVAAVCDRRMSSSGEGVGNHLPDFACFHVNGTMPTAERDNLMDEFRAAPKAVMSNARCLTEGVDVPAVDMVAFLTPKRSKVDIVQATGRAMRKTDGKNVGYILVPLFVEQAKGESIEEAIQRAEFDEVWNVLQAMQEQDEVLADIIRQMREERGRTKGFDDRRFREKMEVLGPTLSLTTLRDSITAACFDRLGVSWDERYGELKAFKTELGHCNVPYAWKENPALSAWVNGQRMLKREGKCDQLREDHLSSLGFMWEVFDSRWERIFSALVLYKNTYGDCNVPPNSCEYRELWQWTRNQRNLRSRGQLPDARAR
jgi:predicted helicase